MLKNYRREGKIVYSPPLVSHYERNRYAVSDYSSTDDDSIINEVPVFVEEIEKEKVTISPFREKRGSYRASSRTPNDVLKDNSYKILSAVTVKDKKGDVLGHYTEAIDPLGSSVMVETPVSTRGSVSVPFTQSTHVPESKKKDELSKVQPNSKGVAYKCEEGTCFLSGDGVSFEEVSISSRENKILKENSLRSVPIVSLEEIERDPETTLLNTSVSTRRIMNSTLEEVTDTLSEIDTAMKDLHASARELFLAVISKIEEAKEEAESVKKELSDKSVNLSDGERVELMSKGKSAEDEQFKVLRIVKDSKREMKAIEKVTAAVKKLSEGVK